MSIPDWLLTLLKSPQIIAVLLTAISGILLRPRPRVVWGTSHQFSFRLPRINPPAGEYLLHTQTVFLQNLGFAPAEGIEVILNFKPEHFSVWPQLNYSTAINPENRFIIKIENLGRREYTTIEMLHSTGEMPTTLRVRTSRGESKQVPMAPMQVFPKPIRTAIILVLLLGVFTVFEFLAFLALKL